MILKFYLYTIRHLFVILYWIQGWVGGFTTGGRRCCIDKTLLNHFEPYFFTFKITIKHYTHKIIILNHIQLIRIIFFFYLYPWKVRVYHPPTRTPKPRYVLFHQILNYFVNFDQKWRCHRRIPKSLCRNAHNYIKSFITNGHGYNFGYLEQHFYHSFLFFQQEFGP